MADFYKIGINIALQNNVSQVLSVISKQLLGVNASAQQLQGTLNRVKLAAVGAAGFLGGAAVLVGMGKLVQHGEKLVHQQALLRQQMPGADVAAATANAWKTAGDVLGSNVTDNLKLTRELIGILGTLKDAQDALPEVAKASLVLSTTTGKDSANSMQTLMKALELRGGVVNPDTGHIDPRQFKLELNEALKTMTASGGIISPNDLAMVVKQAGPMARMMSPQVFYDTMMSVIMEMGGARAGTALTAFGRVAYGGIMPERNAKEMHHIGLFNDDAYHVGRGGHVMVDQNALKGMDILNTKGLDAWFNTVLKPTMEKAGYTTPPQQMQELYRLLPTETARRLAGLFLQQHETVARDVNLRSGANGTDAYADLSKTDPTLQMKAFKEAWDNLLTSLGAPMVTTAYGILGKVTVALTGLSLWASEHPETVRTIEVLTAGAAAAAVVFGGIALGVAAITAAGTAAVPAALLALAAGIKAISAAIPSIPKWMTDAGAGAAVGGAVGSVVPGLGTALGAGVGALGGVVAGSLARSSRTPSLPDAAEMERRAALPHVGAAPPAAAAPAAQSGVFPGGVQRESYTPPAANDNPTIVHSIIYLDGKLITTTVSQHQARSFSAPPSGTAGFDPRMTQMPTGATGWMHA